MSDELSGAGRDEGKTQRERAERLEELRSVERLLQDVDLAIGDFQSAAEGQQLDDETAAALSRTQTELRRQLHTHAAYGRTPDPVMFGHLLSKVRGTEYDLTPFTPYPQSVLPVELLGFPTKAHAIESALAILGWEIRLNERSQRTEWRWFGDVARQAYEEADSDTPPPDLWRPLRNTDRARLRQVIGASFVWADTDTDAAKSTILDIGRDDFRDALLAMLATRRVDPFMSYLAALPAWDGEPRIDGLLSTLYDVGDEGNAALAAWAGRFMFLGAVWRTFEPGTKLDEIPVLIGGYGIGKSTLLRALLPPSLPSLFNDGLVLAAADDKLRVESMLGAVVVEASEMVGVNRGENENIKAFLSRQYDQVRLAYREDAEQYPRRCIIIGTADGLTPLPDDPNLRRFAPVHVKPREGWPLAVFRDYFDTYREQMWAEAKHLYAEGVTAFLPEHLKADQRKAADSARSRNAVLEDAIDSFLATAIEGFQMKELIESSHLLQEKDQKRLSGLLNERGYAVKQNFVNGVKGRRWYPAPPQAQMEGV